MLFFCKSLNALLFVRNIYTSVIDNKLYKNLLTDVKPEEKSLSFYKTKLNGNILTLLNTCASSQNIQGVFGVYKFIFLFIYTYLIILLQKDIYIYNKSMLKNIDLKYW